MPDIRYHTVEARGIARRNTGMLVDVVTTVAKPLSATTVRRRVRDMRRWAAGTYDTFTDVRHGDGTRVVTARHYVAGVENVRTLRIEAAR